MIKAKNSGRSRRPFKAHITTHMRCYRQSHFCLVFLCCIPDKEGNFPLGSFPPVAKTMVLYSHLIELLKLVSKLGFSSLTPLSLEGLSPFLILASSDDFCSLDKININSWLNWQQTEVSNAEIPVSKTWLRIQNVSKQSFEVLRRQNLFEDSSKYNVQKVETLTVAF